MGKHTTLSHYLVVRPAGNEDPPRHGESARTADRRMGVDLSLRALRVRVGVDRRTTAGRLRALQVAFVGCAAGHVKDGAEAAASGVPQVAAGADA